jgi:hypothetical protein
VAAIASAIAPRRRPLRGERDALLMLANIFVLLICDSVIKTVREPRILREEAPT